ncbi:MAG: hypothetical protein FJ104_14920, partial [Deltaproteobacteria bacterium]|nr:hypothetical protein [Deltaproteobacteria bacterium]
MSSSPRVFVMLAALALSGCPGKPAPGDACKPTDIRCADPATELACESGKLVAAPCRGPLGCREEGDRLLCDFSGNAEGDRCSRGDEGAARCVDPSRRISCRGGTYRIDSCRGEQGCASTGSGVRCDQSRGAVGDRCEGGMRACTLDGAAVLECYQGALAVSAR